MNEGLKREQLEAVREPKEIGSFTVWERILYEFATVGPAGRFPKAPGTMGGAVGALLAPFVFLPLSLWWRCGLVVILFVLGGLAAGKVEKLHGKKDPGSIVVDEVVGQWVVFLPFLGENSPSVWGLVLGFVLFRAFDIFKPPPVKWSEFFFPGGFGVMIDDIVAGAYGALVLWIMRMFVAGL